MMNELLIELAQAFPVVAVLLFWVNSERKERQELKQYHREANERHMRIILAMCKGDPTPDV